MEVLLIAIMGLFNILCLVIGAKIGQATKNGERIELPNLNPLKAYKESQARKEAQIKQDKFDAVLRNIDRYDGTSRGQEDVG